jgi:hypothetical protein
MPRCKPSMRWKDPMARNWPRIEAGLMVSCPNCGEVGGVEDTPYGYRCMMCGHRWIGEACCEPDLGPNGYIHAEDCPRGTR